MSRKMPRTASPKPIPSPYAYGSTPKNSPPPRKPVLTPFNPQVRISFPARMAQAAQLHADYVDKLADGPLQTDTVRSDAIAKTSGGRRNR